VIFVKDMLFALLALVSAVLSAVCFYVYLNRTPETMYFVGSILFIVLTVILGGLFLSGRVNRKEDIHITE
jgi:drug/metabolite transporter (DMT)-like permease